MNKKKPGLKGISIREPAAPVAPRATIDMTNMVVAKPLASKPPLQSAPKEMRSKQKHEPSKLKQSPKKAPAPTKPKMTEAEIRKKEKEDAKLMMEKAKGASTKQKLSEANKAAEAAEAKRKLAEVAQKEKEAVAEAEQLKQADAARRVALATVATKTAEKRAKQHRNRLMCLKPLLLKSPDRSKICLLPPKLKMIWIAIASTISLIHVMLNYGTPWVSLRPYGKRANQKKLR